MDEGDYMSVIDIKSAYRAVPIMASHRNHQGFEWVFEGKSCWFVDNCMCFGLRLGPMYFTYLSTLVTAMS